MHRIRCATVGRWILSRLLNIKTLAKNPFAGAQGLTPLLLVLCSLLAACTPSAAPTTESQAAWGPALTIAQAEQVNAPALWVANDRVTTAWVGADATGVHQDIRLLTPGGLSATAVLPLPPVYPYDQTIYPGQLNYTHFLWLDAAESGENRLYNALITPDLTVERGPTTLSTAHTLRYTALTAADGGLQIVWSGGLLAETALYYQTIDVAGRPGTPLELTLNADWPSLTRANDGTRYLVWLRPTDNRLFYAVLTETGLTQISEIATLSHIEPDTRLFNVQIALDATHLYVFWNTVNSTGEAQTWLTSREITGAVWSSPAAVGLDLTAAENRLPFETGFNTGSAQVIEAGTEPVSWLTALSGQNAVLPAAAQVGADVALLYFQGGEIRAYQPITPAGLIGLPGLAVDQDRYLYLAWSQPGTLQADLRLTSLRLAGWLPPAD